MQRKMSLFIGLGLFFAILALICSIIALGTDHWMDVWRTTGAPAVNESIRHEHHPHHFGLLRECMCDEFTGAGVDPLDLVNQFERFASGISTRCFYIDLQIPPDHNVNFRNKEWHRFHLMRATFGLMAFAIFSLFLSVILGFYAVHGSSSTLHRFNTILLCFCAFFVAAAIAFFHGTIYLEQNILTRSSDVFTKNGVFKGQPKKIFLKGMTGNESKYLDYCYSWSYAFAWLACIFAWIAAVMFAVGGRFARKSKQSINYETASSTLPLDTAGRKSVLVPAENYGYFDFPQEVFVEDQGGVYSIAGSQPAVYPDTGVYRMPQSYELLEEYYTPDGKPAGVRREFVEPRYAAKH